MTLNVLTATISQRRVDNGYRPHVCLKFGTVDIATWPIDPEDWQAMPTDSGDRDEWLQSFVAAKLRPLFAQAEEQR